MPGEQTLQGQRLVVPLRRIQHQLREPFAADSGRALFMDAQASCERGAHGTHVQLFTLDRRRSDNVLQEGIQDVLALTERVDGADLAQ
ncbi:hypothetical protein D3C80_1656650 [compost metagenome]